MRCPSCQSPRGGRARRGFALLRLLLVLVPAALVGWLFLQSGAKGELLTSLPVDLATVRQGEATTVELALDPSMGAVSVELSFEGQLADQSPILFWSQVEVRGPSGAVLGAEPFSVRKRERRPGSNQISTGFFRNTRRAVVVEPQEAGSHVLRLTITQGLANLSSLAWSIRTGTPAETPSWLFPAALGSIFLAGVLRRRSETSES